MVDRGDRVAFGGEILAEMGQEEPVSEPTVRNQDQGVGPIGGVVAHGAALERDCGFAVAEDGGDRRVAVRICGGGVPRPRC